jgi:hypothetical protein
VDQDILFFERQFMPTWALSIVAVVGLGIPALVFFTKGVPAIMVFMMIVLLFVFALFASMQTRVTTERLIVTFGLIPLIRFSYKLHEISDFKIRSYHPMNEYGGWGIKGSKLNRALSMQGNEGMQMDMVSRDGSHWKLLIGSQMAPSLEQALIKAKHQYIFQPEGSPAE